MPANLAATIGVAFVGRTLGAAVANAILRVTLVERHRREVGAESERAAIEGARSNTVQRRMTIDSANPLVG